MHRRYRSANGSAIRLRVVSYWSVAGCPIFAFFQQRMGDRDRSFSAPQAGSPTAGGSRLETLFHFGRRQIVLAGDHLSTGLAFKFEPGAMGNPAASLCGLLVGGQAHRRRCLRDLTSGKLGQGREDELRLSDLLGGVFYA